MTPTLFALALLSGSLAAPDFAAAVPEVQTLLTESPEWNAWAAAQEDFDYAGQWPGAPVWPVVEPWRQGPCAGEASLPEAPADAAAWEARRAQLAQWLQFWITGRTPPAPETIHAQLLEERDELNSTRRLVRLSFGPDKRAQFRVELFIPAGEGPHPVFITQHNHRQWGLIALRRGYLTCVYSGSDSQDDTASFSEAYPEYDMAKLVRRAWAASRVVDYLEEAVPQADLARIGITGHSRNGKTALMAAAFDPRFGAVISSSSGAGGALPARLYNERTFGEGIEMITRRFPDWFHPRWRFFAGRPEQLPVDLHHLIALIAPRAVLFATAMNDNVESTWGIERTYHALQPVWGLYEAQEQLRIDYRPHGHETHPAVIERYVDWCDRAFGRGDYAFAERLFHPDEAPAGAGTGSPPAAESPNNDYGYEPRHIEQLLGRASAGARLEMTEFVFGEYINADIYHPRGGDEELLPAILWLHPTSNARGYVPAYRRGDVAHETWARAGYAVFCYDQIGNGRRIPEMAQFCQRYPGWSVAGKMLRDAQAALDAVAQLDFIDPARIYVVGYREGAWLAERLQAVASRPAGYVAVSPVAVCDGLDPAWTRGTPAPEPVAGDAWRVTLQPAVTAETPLGRASLPGGLAGLAGWQAEAGARATVTMPTYDHFDPRVQVHVLEVLAAAGSGVEPD